jgi:putative oxidoreductase
MFEDICATLGRALVGGAFVWDAIDKLKNWDNTKAIFKKKKMSRVEVYLGSTIACKLLGGALVFIGYFIPVGAALLLLAKIPSILKFHLFWNQIESEKSFCKHEFMRDLIIVGSLLILLAIGLGY